MYSRMEKSACGEAGKRNMGKLDVKDRPFFSNAQRFAELINYEVYRGKRILLPENLILLKRIYPSFSGISGGKERDVIMKDKKSNICYGIEIETESDYSMPERIMVYDVCEYEYQIKEIHKRHMADEDYVDYREKKSRMKEKDFILPVITVVLYLGEGKWQGKSSLRQMFPMVEEGEKLPDGYPSDYTFPLIEADAVNPAKYRTDLKEFFQAMQCRQDKRQLIKLLQSDNFQNLSMETEQIIAVHLNMKGLLRKMEKEEKTLCRAIRDWMEEERNKGIKEGKKEGKKEGRKEEKLQIIRRMQEKGMEEKLIRQLTKCSKEEFSSALLR